MRALLACLVASSIACGPPKASEVPTWERPGLGGAVRPDVGSPQPGELAPDFELPRLDGSTARLSSLRGSWVLLHFTASWCPYCDSEIAHLGRISDEWAARGLRVVLVDVKEDESTWSSYARTHVAPSVIAVRDGSGDASKRFAPPRAQPSFTDRAQVALDSTLIIDPAGTIRLFLMPDSAHFDPTFAAVVRELDRMMPREETLPPDRVVEIATTPKTDEVVVTLKIRNGYHVMSNQPSQPNYVATRVSLDGGDAPIYPSATSFRSGDETLSTFMGDVDVRVPLHQASGTVTGTVRYQACTATRCLFPVTREISVVTAR